MAVYIIYGKRTGFNNKYDKTFRALDPNGIRVNKLENAMAYATKEDALEILNKPEIQDNIALGLLEFDVRKG